MKSTELDPKDNASAAFSALRKLDEAKAELVSLLNSAADTVAEAEGYGWSRVPGYEELHVEHGAIYAGRIDVTNMVKPEILAAAMRV